jgi:hypothetical protein
MTGAVRESDLAPLTKREATELQRRYADMMDPTRYVIVSAFSRRFCLYYRPADGDFIMNEITPDTFFKRRSEAVAVARVVEGRKKKGRPGRLQVIAVRKTKRGVRIMEKVTGFRNPTEEWKPLLKRKDAQPDARPNEDPRRSLKHKHR